MSPTTYSRLVLETATSSGDASLPQPATNRPVRTAPCDSETIAPDLAAVLDAESVARDALAAGVQLWPLASIFEPATVAARIDLVVTGVLWLRGNSTFVASLQRKTSVGVVGYPRIFCGRLSSAATGEGKKRTKLDSQEG